jgi:hypothetical protein
MTTDKTVSAQFGLGLGDLGPKAKIGMTGYNSVNDAYSASGQMLTSWLFPELKRLVTLLWIKLKTSS